MQRADIVIGEECGLVEKRALKAPLQHVRVLQQVGRKWKVEWIDPTPGRVDIVEAWNLVVPWSERHAFIADRNARVLFEEDNSANGFVHDSPMAHAVTDVFDAAADEARFDRGDLSGSPAAVSRLRQRARLDPDERTACEFVDRNGVVHVPYGEALKIAKAFSAAEPATVVAFVEFYERDWEQKGYLGDALGKARPAWALMRQWAGDDPMSAMRSEVERLRRLVLDAMYALQEAGYDDVAGRLRKELGLGVERRHKP